jgi:N utilization substance protein A
VEYIANSLSPAKVLARDVFLDIENRTAKIYVDHSCFSLAIGKEGLNVKLAARLTGYKLDVSSKDTEPPSEQDV